jgi:hypothetical protein
MKTYVWEFVSQVTTDWHNGGGLLIITDIDPQDQWKEYRENKINHGESWESWDKLTEKLPEPDFSYDCYADFRGVWVFPDAGCC